MMSTSQMFIALRLSALVILPVLAACSSRFDLAPPPGGPQLSVTVKVPEGASPMPIQAHYLSDRCFPRQSGPFNQYGEQLLEVKPERQGDSDLYEARLDRDGGSLCRWRLSYVGVGVKYWRAGKLGLEGSVREDVTAGLDVDPKQLDNDRLPAEIREAREVVLRPDYYPYVSFVGSGNAQIEFLGHGDRFVRAPRAQSFRFEPQVHRDTVMRMRKKGSEVIFMYPDGSETPWTSGGPDVERLETIRLGSERRQ